MKASHILVLGAGSAGKRHARNLRQLGCVISVFDPRADRLAEASGEGPVQRQFTDLPAALSAAAYDGFMIASPPIFHVDQVLEVTRAQPRWVLCEKPLSINATEARRLLPVADRVLLAYTYRWWPPVVEFRRRLHAGDIGAPRHLRFVMSAHLADWHPWERYQDFFMASRELGGGALLDESHFVDLMLWLLGRPESLFASVDKISDLEINTDDNVDILVGYAGGLRVNLHLDLIGRPYERSITAVGEAGTLVWNYEDNSVKLGKTGERTWEIQTFGCERNEMFLGAAREFLSLVARASRPCDSNEQRTGGTPVPLPAAPSCSVADGIAVLEVLDLCRRSAATGQSCRL